MSEQIARGRRGPQFGALALQRFPGHPRIAALCLAHALYAVNERCISICIILCAAFSDAGTSWPGLAIGSSPSPTYLRN
jgi:hypothetical protein